MPSFQKLGKAPRQGLGQDLRAQDPGLSAVGPEKHGPTQVIPGHHRGQNHSFTTLSSLAKKIQVLVPRGQQNLDLSAAWEADGPRLLSADSESAETWGATFENLSGLHYHGCFHAASGHRACDLTARGDDHPGPQGSWSGAPDSGDGGHRHSISPTSPAAGSFQGALSCRPLPRGRDSLNSPGAERG